MSQNCWNCNNGYAGTRSGLCLGCESLFWQLVEKEARAEHKIMESG